MPVQDEASNIDETLGSVLYADQHMPDHLDVKKTATVSSGGKSGQG